MEYHWVLFPVVLQFLFRPGKLLLFNQLYLLLYKVKNKKEGREKERKKKKESSYA